MIFDDNVDWKVLRVLNLITIITYYNVIYMHTWIRMKEELYCEKNVQQMCYK